MFMFLFLFFSTLLLCSFFRLKELFQVKNGLTTLSLFFSLKMPKMWVGRTTLNGEKKEDGLNGLNESCFYFNRPLYTNGCSNCNRKFKDYNKQCLQ